MYKVEPDVGDLVRILLFQLWFLYMVPAMEFHLPCTLKKVMDWKKAQRNGVR